jgi:site-specific recombinase XerD
VNAAVIQKRVAFHTFRHTYTTLPTQNNEDVKVVLDLLWHGKNQMNKPYRSGFERVRRSEG